MLNKPQIGAALIALSSCCPSNGFLPMSPDCALAGIPDTATTVNIPGTASSPDISETRGKPLPVRKIKYRIPIPNPIIDRQQELWNCIFELKPSLMMECIDPIIAAGNCYNDGLNKIMDDNAQIHECRTAQEANQRGGEESEIKKAMIKEAQCLAIVMDKEPEVLRQYDTCFDGEFACLREQIRSASLVCTAEEQEARYGI